MREAMVWSLLSGQVHYTMIGQTPSDAERLRATRGDKLNFVGGERATGLHILIALNTQRGALADARVRRALTLAMDRQAGSRAMSNLTAVHLPGGLSRPGSASCCALRYRRKRSRFRSG